MTAKEIAEWLSSKGASGIPQEEAERMILRHMADALESPRERIKALELQLGVAKRLADGVMAYESMYTPDKVLALAKEFLKTNERSKS